MSRKSVNEKKYNTKNNYKLVKDEDKKEFLLNLSKIKWRYWLNRPYGVFWATAFWKGVNEEYFAKVGFPGIGADDHLYQFPDIYYDEKFLQKGVPFFDKYFNIIIIGIIYNIYIFKNRKKFKRVDKKWIKYSYIIVF